MYLRRVPHSASSPSFLRLTGHPMRWQLLSELSRSDRQVRELNSLVGQRQSLTSYHLAQLRDGGLVTARRSAADRRDTYYSLDLEACRDRLVEAGTALHPGLRLVSAERPAGSEGGRSAQSLVRVLFLCTGNSSRSQMAEAILQQLGGAAIDVSSAGSDPKPLHPHAVQAMEERGVDIGARRSKHLSELSGRPFDHVISLCDRVREACPDLGFPATAHWSIPDPAADGLGYPAFTRTAHELATRIQFWLSAIEHAHNTPEGQT